MMNNALSMLALGQMQSARESIHFDGSYIVEIDGELHTLSELVDFWRENHEERGTEECNTTGINTLTQNQNTGKKSKKSTKKTTTTKK